MEYEKLLNLGTELGYQLMYSGAEIYRVEESVFRLLCAYGLQPQVFAIPNCLIVCIQTPDGRPMTGMRRIPPHGTDIELLEACNDLCRRLCRSPPPVSQAQEELTRLSAGHRAHSLKTLLLGYTITSAFFPPFSAAACRTPSVPPCAVWPWAHGCCISAKAPMWAAFSKP